MGRGGGGKEKGKMEGRKRKVREKMKGNIKMESLLKGVLLFRKRSIFLDKWVTF